MMWTSSILILLGIIFVAIGGNLPAVSGIEGMMIGCTLFASGIACGCTHSICRAISDAAQQRQ